jgi:hypothetical protein
LNCLDDVDAVRAKAERIVEALSGIARLLTGVGSALKVESLARVRESGARDYFLQLEPGVLRLSGSAISMLVMRQDGTTEERGPLDRAPEWLTKALSDVSMAKALRLRDDAGLSWTDVYRLFEVIEAGAGGTEALVGNGWTSVNQTRRFKHSANSVTVAGDEARHGTERGEPPGDPMTIEEARAYVGGLLRTWLER